MRRFMELGITSVEVIDWNDGVVSAVLSFGASRPRCLTLLLAWSLGTELRVYALVPISNQTADRLVELSRASDAVARWDQIVALMSDAARTQTGPLQVVACEEIDGVVLGSAMVPAHEIPELHFFGQRAGNTLGDARLRGWMDKTGTKQQPVPG
jgi:hypothetical protein